MATQNSFLQGLKDFFASGSEQNRQQDLNPRIPPNEKTNAALKELEIALAQPDIPLSRNIGRLMGIPQEHFTYTPEEEELLYGEVDPLNFVFPAASLILPQTKVPGALASLGGKAAETAFKALPKSVQRDLVDEAADVIFDIPPRWSKSGRSFMEGLERTPEAAGQRLREKALEELTGAPRAALEGGQEILGKLRTGVTRLPSMKQALAGGGAALTGAMLLDYLAGDEEPVVEGADTVVPAEAIAQSGARPIGTDPSGVQTSPISARSTPERSINPAGLMPQEQEVLDELLGREPERPGWLQGALLGFIDAASNRPVGTSAQMMFPDSLSPREQAIANLQLQGGERAFQTEQFEHEAMLDQQRQALQALLSLALAGGYSDSMISSLNALLGGNVLDREFFERMNSGDGFFNLNSLNHPGFDLSGMANSVP